LACTLLIIARFNFKNTNVSVTETIWLVQIKTNLVSSDLVQVKKILLVSIKKTFG